MKQVILDSNILIRYLTKDVKSQYTEAVEIITSVESEKVIAKISILVIDETLWALGNFYGIENNVFIPELLKILSLKNIRVIEINKSVAIAILERMLKDKIDFTDLYLFNISEGSKILTFDKKLLKLASN